MCSRFFLLQQHYREVMAQLGVTDPAEFISRYNIAPSTLLPAVRASAQGALNEAVALRWGLVPAWAKSAEDSARHINARSETIAEKPSFRSAYRRRRCVIPASGFYEWKRAGKHRLPWVFRREDEGPFCFAGVWDSWTAPTGEVLESCALITTAPNEVMQPIHDRMPVVLSPEDCPIWLTPAENPPDHLLRTPAPQGWRADRISQYMNNVRHDDPACLTPAQPDESTESLGELPLN
ncbi:MAG: SOS response-associated peptidase [Cephaloticoccus sp.]|nr:SOS response-associated peptidase [Cephaloticoccus sp.]MCF7761209.1 SOS response-associated peptidase [Cephaloticoccus sp.]